MRARAAQRRLQAIRNGMFKSKTLTANCISNEFLPFFEEMVEEIPLVKEKLERSSSRMYVEAHERLKIFGKKHKNGEFVEDQMGAGSTGVWRDALDVNSHYWHLLDEVDARSPIIVRKTRNKKRKAVKYIGDFRVQYGETEAIMTKGTSYSLLSQKVYENCRAVGTSMLVNSHR